MTEKFPYLHALELKFGKGFAKDLMGGECLRLFPLKNVNTDLWSEWSFHILLSEKSNSNGYLLVYWEWAGLSSNGFS